MSNPGRLSMFDFEGKDRINKRYSIFAFPVKQPEMALSEPQQCNNELDSLSTRRDHPTDIELANKLKLYKCKQAITAIVLGGLILTFVSVLSLFILASDDFPYKPLDDTMLPLPHVITDKETINELSNHISMFFIQGFSTADFKEIIDDSPATNHWGLIYHSLTCNLNDMLELAEFACINNVFAITLATTQTSYFDISACLLLLNQELHQRDCILLTSLGYDG